MLRPVEPNYGPNQMVPYDYSQSIVMPGETPNFVFGRPETQVNVSTQYAPNQLPAPSAEGTLSAVAAERRRQYNMDKTIQEQVLPAKEREIAQGVAGTPMERMAANISRTKSSNGTILEIDPVTGKMTIGAEGTAGMTPNLQVIESTGKSLDSAIKKLTGGMVFETNTKFERVQVGTNAQGAPVYEVRAVPVDENFALPTRQSRAFDLTAEERIAWNKSKANLAQAAPELKGLSDKAVAAKMMDRQWIADTISNLREKDRIFNEIAQKSAFNRAASDAANQAALKREQMLQQLMELQDNLRPARPVQKGGQGPKTRAFQRNMLTPEQEIQNALAK
jgi:hypothetical protein